MQKLFLFLLIAFLVLAGISTLNKISLNNNDIIWLNVIGFIIAASTLFSAYRVNSSLFVSQAKFNAVFFGTMFLKMFFALFLIGIYLKFNDIRNKIGVIFIVCSYFIYTCFEIQFILSKLRSNSKKNKNEN
ncbi:MAG: hypothetical protein HQ463_04265 [Bacteroidetes bacterium]|nr:hypothetical protein [Bacteroidota bacterium]